VIAALAVAVIADDRGERVMAVVLLAAIIGCLWWFGGHPTRPPRLLGSLGSDRTAEDDAQGPEVRVGGIGRFARPRTRERR